MMAVLSRVNDCPYCGDMLVSLVHGGGKHEAAAQIFSRSEEEIADPILRERLEWVKAVATPGAQLAAHTPFTAEQLPEVIGSLLAMSHINRFSHVVMGGSPVNAPWGFQGIKAAALRMFGSVLKTTTEHPIQPGRALDLLPPAPLPDDMYWAEPKSQNRCCPIAMGRSGPAGISCRRPAAHSNSRARQSALLGGRTDADQPKLGGQGGSESDRPGSCPRPVRPRACKGAVPG